MNVGSASASQLAPCMKCIGTAQKQLERANAITIDISCDFGRSSSSRCTGCQEKKEICATAPGGMIGDSVDLMLMLAFGNALVAYTEQNAEGDETYAFTEENRQAIATVGKNLLNAFVAAEMAHRRQFGLGGTKKPSSSAFVEYASLVAARRQLNLQLFPRPTPSEETSSSERTDQMRV